MSGTKILWGQILVVGLLALAGVWLATEWTAWRLGFQPQLGPAWFYLGRWPIYPPPAFFFWWFVFFVWWRDRDFEAFQVGVDQLRPRGHAAVSGDA